MLNTILMQWSQMPEYLKILYEKHLIFVAVVLVLYLIALFFWNKFANFVRWLYVIAAIGFLAYAYFRKNWCLLWIVVASMLVMILWRAIFGIIRNVKQRNHDKKIERKALEKAAKRRGDWEKKQAYSGSKRPAPEAQETPASAPAAPSEPAPVQNAAAQTTGTLPKVSQNTGSLTDLIDDAPKNPRTEIEATKAELSKAAETGRFDLEAIEAALKERADKMQ